MQRFHSWDGTELAYRLVGSGPPLVCVPGGPGQAVEYLGELGGLSAHRALVLLHNRGTGSSDVPADPATYRIDRIVDDVEALRCHLGLDRMDLLGHSASGGVCLLYAAEHPERLNRLVVVAPSLRVVGIQSDIGVAEVLAKRAHESWHAEAVAALTADAATAEDLQRYRWQAAPLLYGQWNAAAQAQAAAEPGQFAQPATDASTPGSRRIRPCPNGSRRFPHRRCSWSASTTSGRLPQRYTYSPRCSATPTWWCSRAPGTSRGWMTRRPSQRRSSDSSRPTGDEGVGLVH